MEMEMQGEAAASWWKSMLIETAKQELELLESKFPNQFEFFKNELKSIIIPSHTPTSSIATQASTNVMKRKREEVALHSRRRRQSRRLSTPRDKSKDVMRKREEVAIHNRRRRQSCRLSTPIDKCEEDVVERMNEDERVDVALERANACIQKIHELKTQFLIC